MTGFVLENRRWLAVGFLLTFASSFGQTWFISLFAAEIKAAHGLTDGSWGTLYTVATMVSAGILLTRGSMADTMPLARLIPATALLFALAAIGIAYGGSIWTLVIALIFLRFCGQGMFSHIAMTAMGRWFQARRGQAVSISNLGHPAGEVVLPILTVLAIGWIGWQATWMVAAALLTLVFLPLLLVLLREGRTAQGRLAAAETPGLGGRHWDRVDALRHWLFPALLPIVLTPGFVGTVVFFHQVHIAGVKGWTLAQMAPGYSFFATATVVSALLAGWAADRFGPQRLLPMLLIPTGLGVLLIGQAEAVWVWFAALGLAGVTQGVSASLWGVLLPTVYGTRNLGSVRAMVSTVMVLSTAIGPGLTGILIDFGIDFPSQCIFLALWCFALTGLGYAIGVRLTREV
jgi:sugar phosphate permease